jgi:hypothetical protein
MRPVNTPTLADGSNVYKYVEGAMLKVNEWVYVILSSRLSLSKAQRSELGGNLKNDEKKF